MLNILNNNISLKVLIVLSTLTVSEVMASAEVSFHEVEKPLYERSPERLSFYVDESGDPGLAYKYRDSSTTGDVLYTELSNSNWIEPQATNLLNMNEFQLSDIVSLNATSNMLLMRGDDTDYLKVFGLSAPPPEPANDTAPVIPGISNDELDEIINTNQRLFFSIKTATGWSASQFIPGTNKAINARLYSAADDTAIAIYALDPDNNTATVNDIELYYVYYKNNVWSSPVKLTTNAQIDYAVDATYANGQYIITWIVDQDSNMSTTNDSRIYYSAVASSGLISKTATPAFITANPSPIYVVGRAGQTPLLIWSDNLTDGTQVLKESRYITGVWTTPTISPYVQSRFTKGKLFDVNGDLVFVHQLGGRISIARHNGVGWSHIDEITEITDKTINVSEIDFSIINNELWIAYSGRTSIVNEGLDPDIGDGLYIGKYPLSYDLNVNLVYTSPGTINVGDPVVLNFEIDNKGITDSPAYNLDLYQSGSLLTSLNGISLAPNAVKKFKHTLTPQSVSTNIRATIVADALDIDVDNNSKEYKLTSRPDFYIKSVTKTGVTTITVDARERKGLTASSSPKLDAFLIQGNVKTLVSSGVYDPASVDPVIFDIPQLSIITGNYKIQLEINSAKSVVEDDYTNNIKVYEAVVATEPDYRIDDITISATDVIVNVSNAAVLNSSVVDLLITDDPLQAAQQTVILVPWHFVSVTLDATGKSTITIPRSSLPAITGQYLYAVINPYNTILETDRNNNLEQALVAPVVTQSGLASVSIISQQYGCENLGFDIMNTGSAPAKQVTTTITNFDGMVVASNQLPLLATGVSENIVFHNIAPANYTVGISHVVDNKPASLIVKAITLANNNCVAADNTNDFDLSAVNYLGVDVTSGYSMFDIDIRIAGYSVDYRKPLVRVPLDIEIKQGTTLITAKTVVLYVSPTINQNFMRVQLPANEIPAVGGYTFTAKIKNRADEVKTSNNILTTQVN